MSLRFSYAHLRTLAPIASLGGRSVRPRPLVTAALLGPGGSWVTDALLDTGADDTTFPEPAALLLGIDLTNAPVATCQGIGQGQVTVRYAEVTLRLADNQEQREWRGWVGFTPAQLRHSVLGFAGCLQYFTATFYGDREEVELAVNALYPGT